MVRMPGFQLGKCGFESRPQRQFYIVTNRERHLANVSTVQVELTLPSAKSGLW